MTTTLPQAVHAMTLQAFAQVATCSALENHGRKWVVRMGPDFHAFADTDTSDLAIRDVHWATVSNAVYFNSEEIAPYFNNAPTMPPAHVLAEYPDLQVMAVPVMLYKAKKAEQAFTRETERAYGAGACDMRYLATHVDAAVQAAADAKKAADADLHHAIEAARTPR